MLPLYDMLAKAQNGRATEELARQYGLSVGQAQAALEALLPAFSRGLRQNASDPFGVGAFLSALSTGRHAGYYENPGSAFSPSGVEEGNGVLGHLFGSPEVSRAVAAEAARATGLAQETLQRMLPALAAMIMGGLFSQASGGGAAARTGNPLQEIMERMMRQGSAAEATQPRSPQSGGGYDNPFGRMFEEMLSGGRAHEDAPPEAKESPGDTGNPYDEIFGRMFESGRQTSEDYRKSMESVFDRYLGGMDRQGPR